MVPLRCRCSASEGKIVRGVESLGRCGGMSYDHALETNVVSRGELARIDCAPNYEIQTGYRVVNSQHTRMIIRDRLRAAVRSVGLEISHYTGSLTANRASLMSRLAVDVVYDVGASVGQYAHSVRQSGFRGPIHSIEPNPTAFRALRGRACRDAAWFIHPCAVGSEAGTTATLNISKNSQSSSLLPIGDRHLKAFPDSHYTHSSQVEMRTLADLVRETSRGGSRLAVKIDVQGHELAVLEGADQVLDRVALIELELSLVPLYERQPPASTLWRWLEEAKFTVVDVDRVCWDQQTGDLLQVNLLSIAQRFQ